MAHERECHEMVGRTSRRALAAMGLAGALIATAGIAGAAPATPGSWSGLMDWNNFVAVHLAVSPTGDVLIWDREEGLTSARRWNPATGTFTGTPGLVTALFCAFQTRLPGGQLVVVGGTALKKGGGGTAEAGTGLEQTRIFDWASNTWSVAASMRTPRWYPTTLALPDGRQVALGGQLKPTVMANLSELYNPATNTWTELTGLAQPKPLGLYPRAIVGPNGKIFVVKNGVNKSAYMDVDTQTLDDRDQVPAGTGRRGDGHVRIGKAAAVQHRPERDRVLGHRSQRGDPDLAQGRIAQVQAQEVQHRAAPGRPGDGDRWVGRRFLGHRQGGHDAGDLGPRDGDVGDAAQPRRAPHVPLQRSPPARRPGAHRRWRADSVGTELPQRRLLST